MSLRRIAVGLCLMFCLQEAGAQVDISLSFKKDFFLADEAMLAELTIVNYSGRSIVLGEKADWLTFSIESSRNKTLSAERPLDIYGRFEIPNAGSGIRRVHLVPAFRLQEQGSYQIKATVVLPELGFKKSSEAVEVNILSANLLWEREFGLVSSADGKPPEIRRYELMRSINEKSIELYVRVSSQYRESIFGVYSLGNVVSFGEPERQVDRLSNLHVLFQNGARSFRYAIIKPNGEILLQQRWDYTNTRPRLSLGEQGLIEISGGMRQISYDDIPSPEAMNQVRSRIIEVTESNVSDETVPNQPDSDK